jgi:hypothetical protein
MLNNRVEVSSIDQHSRCEDLLTFIAQSTITVQALASQSFLTAELSNPLVARGSLQVFCNRNMQWSRHRSILLGVKSRNAHLVDCDSLATIQAYHLQLDTTVFYTVRVSLPCTTFYLTHCAVVVDDVSGTAPVIWLSLSPPLLGLPSLLTTSTMSSLYRPPKSRYHRWPDSCNTLLAATTG